MKRILLTAVLACAVSSASAENLDLDPKKIASDVTEQYIKNLNIPLPRIVDIPVPEQLDLGIKKSRYQFESGVQLDFKTRDPLRAVGVEWGNHNYQIRQDSLSWTYSKTLNKDRFGQLNLKKFLD